MRTLPVLFRDEAVVDLEDVATYLVVEGADSSVVMGFIARIEAQCLKIGDMPEGYPRRPDLGPDIRLAPFERSAVIAYRLADDTVEIVNVFYGGRDYSAIAGD